jgi:Ras family protein A
MAHAIRKKLVIVGDAFCGKSFLLIRGSQGKCLDMNVYVPTLFETYVMDVVVDGKEVELALWDTSGYEDNDRYRLRSYPDTDVVVIVFSFDNPDSLETVEWKWLPELDQYCPGCPLVLVGCKADLQDDATTIAELKKRREQGPVTDHEARFLAAKIGAAAYLSCSAKTGFNVMNVFEVATHHALLTKHMLTQKREQMQAVQKDKKETLVKKAKTIGLDGSAMNALCHRLRGHMSKHTAVAWISALYQLDLACINPDMIAAHIAGSLRDEYTHASAEGAAAAEAAACLKSHVEAVLCEPLQQLVDLVDPKQRSKELSSLTSRLLAPDWWYPAAVVAPMESVYVHESTWRYQLQTVHISGLTIALWQLCPLQLHCEWNSCCQQMTSRVMCDALFFPLLPHYLVHAPCSHSHSRVNNACYTKVHRNAARRGAARQPR